MTRDPYRADRVIYRVTLRGNEKKCKECRRWFPATLDNFYAHRASPDGLDYTCKPCVREKASARGRERYRERIGRAPRNYARRSA